MPTHTYPVHVFWEDTDAGGIVYHANYLKFMERARSTWLTDQGFRQVNMLDETGVVFVVSKAQLQYKAPARLDDDLTVNSEVKTVRRASITFTQTVMRGNEVLVIGEIQVVSINRAGVPCAIPENLMALYTH